MFSDDRIVGSWSGLAGRLDIALAAWAGDEPALVGVSSAADLVALTAGGSDPDRADDILGALIRQGSQRGGDDRDAVLAVLHLLSPGVESAARDLADLHPHIVDLLIGELTVAIRSYGEPGPRGGGVVRRAFAANLLRDARRRVLRELRPCRTPDRPYDIDALINGCDAVRSAVFEDPEQPGAFDGGAAEDLADVLLWGQLTGVVDPWDARVLVAAEISRDRRHDAASQREIAARFGVTPSTLRRRRDQAISALRAARADYFANWLAA